VWTRQDSATYSRNSSIQMWGVPIWTRQVHLFGNITGERLYINVRVNDMETMGTPVPRRIRKTCLYINVRGTDMSWLRLVGSLKT